MALVCEDLARYGVVLLPPSTAKYFELLADIEHRLQNRPKGAPPIDDNALSRISEHDTSGSAILVNQAHVAIASVAYIWSIWPFAATDGRVLPHCFAPGTNPSELLPFGLVGRTRRFHAFWDTIFPSSKRLLMCDGSQFGDNTDVRPPAADELWHGGFVWTSSEAMSDPLKPLKLTLDGIFFVDGGFAGPNRLGSWEQTVFAAEGHLPCAALAREARSKGATPAEFFVQVQTLTGRTEGAPMPPPPPPPSLESKSPDPEPIRKYEQQMVGWRVLDMRQRLGDEAAIASTEAWADAPVPKFHKL
jgi:hypothetical protein